jgi:hypothetical protein
MSSAIPAHGEPLPLRLLLDHAVGVSRRHFRAIYPPIAVPLALASAAFPVAQALFMGPMMAQGRAPGTGQIVALVAVGLVAVAVFLVAYVLAFGSLYMAAVDAAAGRPVSMRDAFRRASVPSVWGTLILSWVGFLAGLLCCLVPGMYLAILWSLIVPVMVEEALHGTAALRRSAELIRYNPQRTLGSDPRAKAFLIVFVGMLMAYALSLVVQLPFIVVQQVYMVRQAASGARVDPAAMMRLMAWIQVPSNVLGSLVQTAVQLYIAIGVALLYFDIRRRREATDLEAGLARIETGAAPAGPAE